MRKEDQVQLANAAARDFDASGPLSIPEWFLISRAREIPDLLPMPAGRKLNLGEGNRPIGNAIPLGFEQDWDGDREPIPYSNETFGGIWAHAFFDYLANPVNCLRECERILMPGGVMNIVGPHGLSDLWAEDMLRKTCFTEESWSRLFSNPWYTAGGPEPWKFEVHACFIMGVNWRNLSLFTQLVKRA